MTIKGMDLCVATMNVGERCRLTVSPAYAYGEEGCPPQIPPNSSLVYEMTLLDFEKPIDTIPERVQAANKMKDEGNALFVAQKYEEAYTKYNEALDWFQYLFPSEEADKNLIAQCKLPILLNQAACQLKLTNFRSARICCEQALDFDPKNVKALFRLGQCWQGMADYNKARENFQNALSFDPNNGDIKKAMINLKRLEEKHKSQEKEICSRMFG